MIEKPADDYIKEAQDALVGGTEFDGSLTAAAATLSIAISMKRIADEICGLPYDYSPGADNSKHRVSLTEGIMIAIEQALLSASHRG